MAGLLSVCVCDVSLNAALLFPTLFFDRGAHPKVEACSSAQVWPHQDAEGHVPPGMAWRPFVAAMHIGWLTAATCLHLGIPESV